MTGAADDLDQIVADQEAMARSLTHKARALREDVQSLRKAVSLPVNLVNLIAAVRYLDEAILALRIASGERPHAKGDQS